MTTHYARLASHRLEAWAQMLERGYVGYSTKDEEGKYIRGRTRPWIKVKVPGWTDAEDRW